MGRTSREKAAQAKSEQSEMSKVSLYTSKWTIIKSLAIAAVTAVSLIGGRNHLDHIIDSLILGLRSMSSNLKSNIYIYIYIKSFFVDCMFLTLIIPFDKTFDKCYQEYSCNVTKKSKRLSKSLPHFQM